MVTTKLLEVGSKGTDYLYRSPMTGKDRRTSVEPAETSINSYYNYASTTLQNAAESTFSTLNGLLSSFYLGDTKTPRAHPDNIFRTPSKELTIDFDPQPIRRSSTWRINSKDLSELVLKNPYNSVRGRQHDANSMSAVRSLLSLVPVEEGDDEVETSRHAYFTRKASDVDPSITELDQSRRTQATKLPFSDAESATQIAEGTLRALRDLALEEAIELHSALRFWTYRWERPVLSWLEAGPSIWTSPEGYNHQQVGQKVSQIQAVLARRLANIGELQEHLLRAGWQKGVAQWGVLGQGAQWAAVAGFDGSMHTAVPIPRSMTRTLSEDAAHSMRLPNRGLVTRESTIESTGRNDGGDELGESMAARTGTDNKTNNNRSQHGANVLVQNTHGGGIFTDDPSFLAQWSIEAIALIRRQLYRAANGRIQLPYDANWRVSPSRLHQAVDRHTEDDEMPQWASRSLPVETESDSASYYITDLPLLAAEVSELLDIMEDVMELQKKRRLAKLRQPQWARRNWYILATCIPTGLWLSYRIVRAGYGRNLISKLAHGIVAFFNDRVRHPLTAIFTELWKGRESFSDHRARLEAIQGLKTMLRSWLDEVYPQMPEKERISMSESMDVSLLERKKEESMKTFYEINSVIRMSFIEMQFLKKEMMNALYAIDEMMSANDINMNLAAITPVVMLAYVQVRVFRFLYYALLKLEKSREETYASFRNILLDIERLLVMRANPPHSDINKPSVLGSNDLGMLMLLIHECRRILSNDKRRFTEGIIRSVSEDLAELAGERGKQTKWSRNHRIITNVAQVL